MESFEEPGHISRENLLEVPTLSDSLSEDEDVKVTLQSRFSPSPRRRNSDSSEEMEPEAPSTIARKVSFADAFGFELVSVKEFDTWEVSTTLPNEDLEDEVVPVEEFYLSPLFIPATTQEELLQKVRAQKVWLESIEFLPGITCMTGIIRVLNVSFQKLVYVRMSLDSWLTYYDILAEYVPNSCDGETDQFLFKISLVPPYQRDGAKVEFCIRYETSVGIFWANNNNHNYILICHKKETAPPVEDNKLQEEEVTNKQVKGCLKTQSSKEEILAMADEDIWNNSRTSVSDIPEILYSHVDDNEIKQSKENVKGKNVEYNEDDNEDNEKELEFLLSQHFTRIKDSSRDERSLYTTEPVKFPNEPQDLGDKLDSGLVRQPLPISSSSEHILQGQELRNTQIYSIGNNYSQLPHDKFTAVDYSTQSSECFSTSETLLSKEYWSGTKENETAHTTDAISSKQGMSHADVPKDEPDSAIGSKAMERLFISEGDYDRHKEIWETRPETVPTEHEKVVQLKENVLGTLDEQSMQETSPQTPKSVLENIIKNEPKGEMLESQHQVYLRGELNVNTLVGLTEGSLRSSHTNDNITEEKYKSEDNADNGEKIKLSILEQFPEDEQACSLAAKPTNRHIKYAKEIQSEPLFSMSEKVSAIDELTRGEEVVISSALDEEKSEEMYESTEPPWLNDRRSSSKQNKDKESTNSAVGELSQDSNRPESRYSEDIQKTSKFCMNYPDFVMAVDEGISTHSPAINLENVFDTRGNLEKGEHSMSYDDPANRNILEIKPCQSEPNRVITDDLSNRVGWGNQSWSSLESQLAERGSGANKGVQMKERTGGEAMWGIRDNTRCLNVTPTDELFICQDPVRYEEPSVAEHDRTGEAEAVTAAYIIKTTSESTPEKMSAGEKAVIVQLPQETALSDRPTEEKETVFDIHEGRNDGSHYPLCQCNTVGVLYDIKFEKESVSDIYNARIHETVQGEMMSVCNTSEKLAGAEHNTGNDSPLGEKLWTSAAEGKTVSKQDLFSETSLKASPYPQQGLCNEDNEVGSILGTFSHAGAKPENKMSTSDTDTVTSYYESSSVTSSEESMGAHTAEVHKVSHSHMDSSVEIASESGCDSSSTSEIAHVIPNISSETELRELPQSSAVLLSSEKAERSVGQFPHQLELKQVKLLGPTILISEPTEEKEETSSESESLITGETIPDLDTEGHDNHAQISGQQSEAHSLPECLVLKHIGYKILYFLLFVVFCVTMYHYDLIVCFALYLFSLYWLYCEGGRSKESIKKE
ncbi:protein phosphatase 1 regulatory subunit 3A [Hemicordylus capensis]|uniref:protein phosphatase 1 regulatory subunit 3A n=1 Tax=Hemicordylus capensis TaxID=884348 RepID=UPI002302E5AA|nr:protein phosphatase 1 regulatory subunit 3A [Hemicordylus capensis]